MMPTPPPNLLFNPLTDPNSPLNVFDEKGSGNPFVNDCPNQVVDCMHSQINHRFEREHWWQFWVPKRWRCYCCWTFHHGAPEGWE